MAKLLLIGLLLALLCTALIYNSFDYLLASILVGTLIILSHIAESSEKENPDEHN